MCHRFGARSSSHGVVRVCRVAAESLWRRGRGTLFSVGVLGWLEGRGVGQQFVGRKLQDADERICSSRSGSKVFDL